MFEHLDIMWLYPVYNATLSCLGVVIISGLKDKNINRMRVAIVGICSLIIGVLVLYTRDNSQVLMYVYEHLIELLPIAITIFSEIDKVIINLMPMTDPSPSGPSSTGPSTSGPSSTGPSTSGPSSTGPSTSGPSSTGPSSSAARDNFQNLIIPSSSLTVEQLDDFFGPPNKDNLKIARDKIVEQAKECYERKNSSKLTIYSQDYSVSSRLTTQDHNSVARQLLAIRNKEYAVRLNLSTNSPKVMLPKGKGPSTSRSNAAVLCNKATIADLSSGLDEQ